MTETQAAQDRHDSQAPPGFDPRLDRHKGWLVDEGERIGRLAMDNLDWKSQIRGILEAARIEAHPKVLENLVRYQAARNKNWRQNANKQPVNVADPLLAAMARCQKQAGDDLPFAMELIRHLLLYTLRAHTYADKLLSERSRRNGDEENDR